MRFDQRAVQAGMTVLSADGEKLGKVRSCERTSFTIEKGVFFPKDYVAQMEDVAEIVDDEIRLRITRGAFEQLRDPTRDETPDPPRTPAESRHVGTTREMDEETRRQLAEDPLSARRKMQLDPD